MKIFNMTNLKKLTESLNLKVLNSDETTSLKGGRQAKTLGSNYVPPPVENPVGGAGLPPNLDTTSLNSF